MADAQEISEAVGEISENFEETREVPEEQELEQEAEEEPSFVLNYSSQLRLVEYSSLACYAAVLGALLWCMSLTVRPILRWRPPDNTTDVHIPPWQVAQAYLLLGALISLFFAVFLLALMVPRMIMTWITAIVFDYLITKSFGRSRQHQIVRTASDFAREISWDTFKNAAREGNMIGIGIVVLCLLPWLFGTSTVLRGVFDT
jgi:ribose/xylose/arabinose/galactoside ABC-type transport system permease subunit